MPAHKALTSKPICKVISYSQLFGTNIGEERAVTRCNILQLLQSYDYFQLTHCFVPKAKTTLAMNASVSRFQNQIIAQKWQDFNMTCKIYLLTPILEYRFFRTPNDC
jgi:hypothetical protein